MANTPRFPQFPIRVDPILISKIRYIGNENCRSGSKEIELLIRQHIQKYENEFGEITQVDIDKLRDIF